MKLNKVDKIKIIELAKNGYSISQISNSYNISKSTVTSIKRIYAKLGIDGFVDKSKNNKYTLDFKLQVIKDYKVTKSYNQTSLKYNIGVGTIYQWVNKFKNLGYNGININQGRPRIMPNSNTNNKTKSNSNNEDKDLKIKELTEQIDTLKMENDLLKKLNALVQQRKVQQNKKK